MTRGRVTWSRVRDLAGEAIDLPDAERASFLEAKCGADKNLRAEVEALIEADRRAGEGFMHPLTAGLPAPDRGRGPPSSGDAAWLIGKRVGHYRVKRLIGAGGMGAVYEAVQEHPRRVVALKVMRPGIASPAVLRRFEHESQVLGRLRHPGIAQIHEAGTHETETGPLPYFAMEYVVSGQPITAFATGRGLGTRSRIELFARVCDAVHHGHQKGVVHRDLKPGNILVDGSGQPKIIDFGVSRAIDADPELTAAQTGVGQMIGTLSYMAPEQCCGDPRDVDTRVDVYSLGVVLYELLTGRLPFDLANAPVLDAARIIRDTPPTPPSRVDRSLRGDIETIALKALEKDRDRRYQSAAELRADIERYLRSEPILARPPSIIYQLQLFARRRRGLVVAGAAVAAGLVVGVGGLTAGLVRAIEERDRARVAEAAADREAEHARRIANFLKTTIGAGAAVHRARDEGDAWDEVAVGPGSGRVEAGRQYTVTDLLERAAGRLDASFPDDPITTAELADLIGATLAQFASHRAEALLRRALDLRRNYLGRDHPDTVASMLRLGLILQGGGAYAPGGQLIREAYESRLRTLGEAHPQTLAAGRHLSVNLVWVGRPAEAEALARALHAIAVAAHGQDSPPALEILKLISTRLMARGELEEAERAARLAYEGLRRSAGPSSPLAAEAANTLAGIFMWTGREAEAVPLLRDSLDADRKRYGEGSARIADREVALATTLEALGEHDEAVSLQRSALERLRRIFGPEHVGTVRREYELARLLNRPDELEEAESLATHALSVYRMGFPPEDGISILYADQVAVILRLKGQSEEAERRLRELISLAQRLGEWAYFLHLHHGQALLDLNRPEEARVALQTALELLDRYKPNYIFRQREIGAGLARAYDDLGQPEEAARWRERFPPGQLLQK